MNRALALASLGRGKTSPNPLVGCVIVKNNRIIGQGWHHQYGHPHAEIEAINNAHSLGHDVRGSTVYVTLEPCSHYGKTPPCANRLIQEGIEEVVIAMKDPNPEVNGKGIDILRNAGIKITELSDFEYKAKFLNRGFVFVHKYGRPFITIKAAMTLDGRMCLVNGSSKWLTGKLARTLAHEIRAENDAVVVGAGTVISDNPELTVRHVKGINPLRIILDTRLSIPADSKVIGTDGKCLIFCGLNADKERQAKLEDAGAEIIRLSYYGARVDIHEAMKHIVQKGILTLMVEGGPAVISAFIREALADYAKLFISPHIFGEGKEIKLNAGFDSVKKSLRILNMKTTRLNEDILAEGRLNCSRAL